jgi:type I restriction-modification system DNA methylase subunit
MHENLKIHTLLPESTLMPPPTDKSLESWIWDAACSIRGAKDAPKFKDYILPLIFTKRLCDVFDDELNRIAKEVGMQLPMQIATECILSSPANLDSTSC